jgi:hypothetical protein
MHAVTTQPDSGRSCDRRLPFLKHPCMMPKSFYPQTGRTMSSEPKGSILQLISGYAICALILIHLVSYK